ERSSVSVVESKRIVLSRISVGHFQHAAPPVACVLDAVRLLSGDHEFVAGLWLELAWPDLEDQSGIENHPHLVPKLVVVLAGLLARLDGDHPDRRGLVQRVGRDLPPGLL